MSLGIFVGTYERKVCAKTRVLFPKEWDEALQHNGPFFLYKPNDLEILTLITEAHMQAHYSKLFEDSPSPVEIGKTGQQTQDMLKQQLESLIGWGPHPVKISDRTGSNASRLQVPNEGYFRQILRPNSQITLIGVMDYIAMCPGDINTAAELLAKRVI